jgi:hypothetical protein
MPLRLGEKQMRGVIFHFGWMTGLLLVFLSAGCTTQPAPPPPAAAPDPAEEAAVRKLFAQLQSAFKDRDLDRVWAMLDSRSKADAEWETNAIQAVYGKASPEEKVKLEEMLGLSQTDAAGLTAVIFMKTKRFHRNYHELPDSKIDKVTFEDGKATVEYIEPDDDHAKVIFVREAGEWKAWLVMPKFSYP